MKTAIFSILSVVAISILAQPAQAESREQVAFKYLNDTFSRTGNKYAIAPDEAKRYMMHAACRQLNRFSPRTVMTLATMSLEKTAEEKGAKVDLDMIEVWRHSMFAGAVAYCPEHFEAVARENLRAIEERSEQIRTELQN